MHYYKFNIGDYASHTRHLSPIEDIAYRRLLDLAYSTETPVPADIHQLSRLVNMREHQEAIQDVLSEFFKLADDGWVHGRVLKEIEEAGDRSEKASSAALARWEKAKAMRKECERNADALINDAASIENDATHYPRPITRDPLPETQIKAIVVSDAGRPDCPHKEIIALYHEILPELPAVKHWTPKRKAALQARWREDEERQNLDFWKRYFLWVRNFPFYLGENDRKWRADVDFLLNPTKFVKMLEREIV